MNAEREGVPPQQLALTVVRTRLYRITRARRSSLQRVRADVEPIQRRRPLVNTQDARNPIPLHVRSIRWRRLPDTLRDSPSAARRAGARAPGRIHRRRLLFHRWSGRRHAHDGRLRSRHLVARSLSCEVPRGNEGLWQSLAAGSRPTSRAWRSCSPSEPSATRRASRRSTPRPPAGRRPTSSGTASCTRGEPRAGRDSTRPTRAATRIAGYWCTY